MTWSISFYGKGSDFLGTMHDTIARQKDNRIVEEVHQIEAAHNLVETICKDNPEAMISVNMSGHAYKGETSQAGNFSASISYSKSS